MLSYSGASNPYKQQDMMTAAPGELVSRLLKGSVRNLELFKKAVDKKDYGVANTNSQKAQNIIIELMRALDVRYDIAKQLLPLYEFVLDTIIQSNIKKDNAKADIAIRFISELNDTWREAMDINRRQTFGTHVSTV
ncbi:MAG: flagellar export chaperone FliS [Oscillospiraceae bacterium]|nr:flagellar export chaperone FliS [Oscillospiraceae bacterium]